MKKSLAYYLLPTTYFMLPLVTAGPIDGVQQLTDGFREILYILFQFIGDTIFQINSFDEFLFAKILLFIIVLLIVYTVLKKNGILGDKEAILWIIASSIAILSIRFIPPELVEFILFQYGALGAGLTIFFPFVIFLFFLHQSNIGPMPRKIGWLLFGMSYIAIWAFRSNSISGTAEYLYWGGILAIAIAFFLDRYIHAKFGDLALQKDKSAHEAQRYGLIKDKITEIDNRLTVHNLPPNIIRMEEKRRKYLYKELRKISKTF